MGGSVVLRGRSTRKPRLLDLFCGGGGAAMGYHQAGFEVVGVDINDQPDYPFEFHQADALTFSLDGFDAIHASPPCQAFTRYRNRHGHIRPSPNLIPPTRELLRAAGLPYVIENVEGAPLEGAVMLCGSSFGLPIRRHRFFESTATFMVPPCAHGWQRNLRLFPPAPNRKDRRNTVEIGSWRTPLDVQQRAMEIDWLDLRARHDRSKGGWGHFGSPLSQAIPPAYTRLLGLQLLGQLDPAAEAA